MKPSICGLTILGVSILFSAFLFAEQDSEKPEKILGISHLLPADDEIPGWKRSGEMMRASSREDLYKLFDGGASLYVQHGFHSFVGQSYKGPKETEIEVHVFDQGTRQNAEDLYENPFTKPSQTKEICNLGEKARIDMTPLFCYGVDLIRKGFFVRVIVMDRTEEGLAVCISFARTISKRIE